MSSTGFPPLALYDPNLYVQQQAIERKQALANALLGSSPGQGAYAGTASAGRNILGAILANRTTRDLGNLYNPQTMGMAGGGNMPQQPSAPQLNQPQQLDPEGNPMPQAAPQMPQQPQMMQPQSNRPADYGSLPPQLQRLYDSIPHVPMLSARESVSLFLTQPQEYSKAVLANAQPTPEMKNAGFAFPGDPNQQQQTIGGALTKAGTTTLTRGMMIGPDGRVTYAPPPAPTGYRYVQGQDGQPYLVQVGGGLPALTASTAAQGLGKAATTPMTGYVNNQPVATNQAAMLGYPPQGGANINANNPLNMQPGGQEARYTTPTAGFGTAWDNLTSYGKSGINTVAGIVHQWTGGTAPPGYAAAVAKALKVDPEQPLNLNDPNVKGALIDAMRPNETGGRYQAPQSPMLPELPPGVGPAATTFGQKTAGAAGDEYTNTKELSADVPTRINVLQNILALSRVGAPTGSPEWMNQARQTAAALSQQLGVQIDPTNPAALMGEIHKYMQQYSSRMAEGGNETDAKRVSAEMANPNLDMFPATLQRVVPWIMANEMGLKAKANFYDDSLSGNPNNPNAAVTAQAQWRNTYQPRVAQFELMTPQQQAGYLADPRAFRSPQDRIAFIQAAKALHPYFKGAQGG